MGKNEKEKQMLYEWGVENNYNYSFYNFDVNKKSYFVKRQEDSYICEYGFKTLPEMIEKLNILWKNDEAMEPVKKIVGVAAMKNRPLEEVEKIEKKEGRGEEEPESILPEFIYNF